MLPGGIPKEKLGIYLVGAGLLGFLCYVGAQSKRPEAPLVITENSRPRSTLRTTQPSPEAPKEPPSNVTVHVTGSVKHPGVYTLGADKRVIDAVNAAQGFTKDADQTSPNLAAHLVDGTQIFIPSKIASRNQVVQAAPPPQPLIGTLPASAPTPPSEPAASTPKGRKGKKEPAGPISLSNATEDQLETVPDIGPATAARIISYRTEHGGFKSVDELTSVGGIGAKKLAKMRPYVTP